MKNSYQSMDYADYLQTEHWAQVRKHKIAKTGRQCEKCGRTGNVDVHHLTYERLGEELMEDLQVLCPICHKQVHGLELTMDDWNRCTTIYAWETVEIMRSKLVEAGKRLGFMCSN